MHRPVIVRAPLFIAALACVSLTASAQSTRASRFVENCQQNGRDREQFCETRTVTLAASATLRVDARANGGVTVHAWDNNQFQIVAMVQSQAETQADAQRIARQISVTASNGEIRADGPSMNYSDDKNESWSVSYEVWAPRHTELSLVSTNGGISIDGMDSKMDVETVNGGLNLLDVAGDVRGLTKNGGVTVELSGDRWRGAGLDLETSNGGIHMVLPAAYSARLQTGTVNGHMDIGVPVTVQGRVSRQLTADLGGGGAMIRAMTTNGGVTITRK